MTELLEIASKNQLFQFEGKLYEQINGVAMGSPLGPLMANAFMCHIEENMIEKRLMPNFYKRYVDDTLVIMPSLSLIDSFLVLLNSQHSAINFTLEYSKNNQLPFLGMLLSLKSGKIETAVYVKPTDKGLHLHFQSHVDKKYKKTLLNTMLHRAYKISSTWSIFHDECTRLKSVFLNLKYPISLIDSEIMKFMENINNKDIVNTANTRDPTTPKTRIVLPFVSQKSCYILKAKINDLNSKINTYIEPIFTSKKIKDSIKQVEKKPKIINEQCVVYKFECDLCDASYVGYTCRHLHERVKEHKNSAIGEHMKYEHSDVSRFENLFTVLKKCKGKWDCLVFEMLYIKKIKPTLNKQCDSIKAKLFK